MNLKNLLDRPIAFHRVFVKFAGADGAILLSQALYWSKRTSDQWGWFYKTRKEWEEETGLTRRQQEEIRKKLTDIGVIEEKRKGIPARLYFRVRLDVLTSLCEENEANQLQKSRTDLLVQANQPQIEAKTDVQTNTEITTETTHIYTLIFDKWNSLSIRTHKTLKSPMITQIKSKLKEGYTCAVNIPILILVGLIFEIAPRSLETIISFAISKEKYAHLKPDFAIL